MLSFLTSFAMVTGDNRVVFCKSPLFMSLEAVVFHSGSKRIIASRSSCIICQIFTSVKIKSLDPRRLLLLIINPQENKKTGA